MIAQIHYSAARLIALELLLGVMVFWPMSPGFSAGLVYTKWQFSPGGSFMRWAAEAIGLLMLIYLLPLIWRALRGTPMFETEDGAAHVHLWKTRTFQLEDVESVDRQRGGNVRISLTDSRPVIVPAWLSIDGGDALQVLQSLSVPRSR